MTGTSRPARKFVPCAGAEAQRADRHADQQAAHQPDHLGRLVFDRCEVGRQREAGTVRADAGRRPRRSRKAMAAPTP